MKGMPKNARHLELLNVAEACRIRQQLPLRGFYADVSQGILRKPWGAFRTMTCSSLVYDFDRDQAVTPLELLALQGMPVEAVRLAPQQKVSSFGRLAGQGMFLPDLGMVMLAYVCNPFAPWWKPA
jgi:hypothetical protein